jgi:transposase
MTNQVVLTQAEKRALRRRVYSNVPGLSVGHPDAAGIDIGCNEHYVAVTPGRDSEPVKSFGCFTADLEQMADWLHSCGVKSIVMQSTGFYWIPVYDLLEKHGFEVWLVNARETRNPPGRKSDVQESQWLLKLHTYLRPIATLVPAVGADPGSAHLLAHARQLCAAGHHRHPAYAESVDGDEPATDDRAQ